MSTHPISSIDGGTRRERLSMPWLEYLEYPALNGSTIVHGRKSMLHLKWAWDADGEDTDAMRFGRMMHCLLLEHREFVFRYAAWDGIRRGKVYDEICAEAETRGAEVVPAAGPLSMASAMAAVPSFLADAKIQSLIKAGQAEQTILVPECGLQCKGRIDWISTSQHVLVDVKTGRDIDERLFGIAFFRYGYDLKLGLYQRWLKAVTNDNWPVQVIVLENSEPYDTAVIPIPQPVLDAGAEKAMRIIEKVRVAIDTDRWPGVAGDAYLNLFVPLYCMDEESEEFAG